MQIGPYDGCGPWILAPMAGVSEMPFRRIARRLGASATPTELVSAKGLCYGQAKTERYLLHDASERPFWVQVFGGDPQSMAVGAERAVELGADIIDVNMGCPVKKVTRQGAGSALMGDPQRAAAIVENIIARTGVPVTAKIRSGWDASQVNAAELTLALAQAGCAAVAVHGRTRAQGYSGSADWQLIKQVALQAPIPIIGNGDLFTAELARQRLRESGCAAVMIGRGALGNPWIFEQLRSSSARPPTAQDRWQLVAEHLRAHLAHHGETARAVRAFRQHLMWYAHGLRGAAAFRRQVSRITEFVAQMALSETFFSSAEPDAARQPKTFETGVAQG